MPAPTPIPEPTSTPIATPRSTAAPTLAPTQLWRGIVVAPEERCSPYDPDDYPYSPSVEAKIVEELGGVYGPYTGRWFEGIRDTDIAGVSQREPPPESRQGRGRVASGVEPMLVRRSCRASAPRVRSHYRPCRGGRDRRYSSRLRVDLSGCARAQSLNNYNYFGNYHSRP